jgi:hypothetical protein
LPAFFLAVELVIGFFEDHLSEIANQKGRFP